MDYFNLPQNTIVQRVVSKNSFDLYANSQQKEAFTRDIAKIIWSNKLSGETINLSGKEISEIQIFTVELKEKKDIATLLNVIDKAIPYHIIFIVGFENSVYISTSSKHSSPLDDTKSVIDWTFKSDWHNKSEKLYAFELKGDIDHVFHEFCQQLSLKPNRKTKDIADLVQYNSQISKLSKEIEQTKRSIASCQLFNKKVELNLKLNQLKTKLDNL
ncbi:MAG: DUF4391 domain-containing protein [Dysgonamonadaceae bacterium]